MRNRYAALLYRRDRQRDHVDLRRHHRKRRHGGARSVRRADSGLFAAGELVGGFHGASYLSATALPKAAISGLRAGKSAAMSNT